MITKEQAVNLNYGTELHFTGFHDCSVEVGPRGGRKVNITTVRVSGRCQTWKTRPTAFRIPVKYGLYESSSMDEANANQFHFASDCSVLS